MSVISIDNDHSTLLSLLIQYESLVNWLLLLDLLSLQSQPIYHTLIECIFGHSGVNLVYSPLKWTIDHLHSLWLIIINTILEDVLLCQQYKEGHHTLTL